MTLKKILVSAAVVGAVVCAAPVAMAHDVGAGAAPAPYYGGYNPYYGGGRGWGNDSSWEDGSFTGDTRGSGRGTGSGEGEFNMNFSGKGRGNMDANTDWDGSGYGGSNNPGYGGYGGRGYGAPYGYGAPRMAPPAAPAAPAKK